MNNFKVENIPLEMKEKKNWVCWSGNKIPINPYTGKTAKSNDPETWSDFDTAVKAVEKFEHVEGIGFMFQAPYFGVDLDHCLDNDDLVQEFVNTLGSYAEISKSGDGIHIYCKGTLPKGRNKKGGIEMYSEKRYFVVTGNIYDKNLTELKDCTELIKPLYEKYLGDDEKEKKKKIIKEKVLHEVEVEKITLEDEEILNLARSCKSGIAFQNLWLGHWEGTYPSQSDADLALCNHLAFWCQCDENQIDRIFRNSELYRPKWDEMRGSATYGQKTVARAIIDCLEPYNPALMKGKENSICVSSFGAKTEIMEIETYDNSDIGFANRFVDTYGDILKYIPGHRRDPWYLWDGKHWEYDNKKVVSKFATALAEKMTQEAKAIKKDDVMKAAVKFAKAASSNRGMKNMLEIASAHEDIATSADEFDVDKDLFNCQNGIIKLETGELIPHDPQYKMRHISGTSIAEEADCPNWMNFLSGVTNGDSDLIEYLQKCVGYSLSGSTEEQCLFFLYGTGRNGKSTFLDIILEILGSYGMTTQPNTLMGKEIASNKIGSDIARLESCRFVTSEEPDEGVRLNEGLVKQLTGGSQVTCRYLYGDEFSYTPQFKIFVATNHKPKIYGTDDGIWRRIRLIPFTVKIRDEDVDKRLKDKLREELPEILRWAVDGYALWRKEGLESPACVENATKEYKDEMDILSSFIEDCLIEDTSSTTLLPSNDIFTVYTKWAKDRKEYTMSSRKFSVDFAKKFPEYKTRSSTANGYIKLKFTEAGEDYLNSYTSYY